jgi:eukaryotic-like serine/threonine-protein kinase
MSAQITLFVDDGRREERLFVVDEQSIYVVGRAAECDIQLGSDATHMDVSRRHCKFEIDTPCVCVRDLGSLNGTFVNGRRIGGGRKMRDSGRSEPEELGVVELLDGDEVRVGHTVIRVAIDVPSKLPELDFFPTGVLWPVG